MVCGHLGCARRNDWDPQNPGGNNHAIEHALSSSHGVAVKLRTITPEGKAGNFTLFSNMALGFCISGEWMSAIESMKNYFVLPPFY